MDNQDAPHAGRPRFGRWPVRVDRLVYTTITLMAVLVIYDGWDELTITGVIAVIVGPVTAIFLSHIFAEALAHRVSTGQPLTRRERRAVLVKESRFLLIVIPPLTLLLILAVAGISYTRSIQVIIIAGLLSLGFWGGLAGRRAGLRGWPLAVSVLYGLCLGCLILVLQAILQPGSYPFRP
jgi:hypothetical protein